MAEKTLRADYVHCLALAIDKIPMSPRISGLRAHVDLFKLLMDENKEYSDAFEAFMTERQKYIEEREKGFEKDWTDIQKVAYMQEGLEATFTEKAEALNKLGANMVTFEIGDKERAFVQANWGLIFKMMPENATRVAVVTLADAFEIVDEPVDPAKSEEKA